MTDPLRQAVADAMAKAHGIPSWLAEDHASRMDEQELLWRFSRYVGLGYASKVSGPMIRAAKGAIGNLTINGMENRAGKLSEVFAHAGSREFPRREPECPQSIDGVLGENPEASGVAFDVAVGVDCDAKNQVRSGGGRVPGL